MSQHGKPAAGGLENIKNHPDGRGLAGAIGAEEAADGASGKRETQVIDGFERAEELGDVGEVEDGLRRGRRRLAQLILLAEGSFPGEGRRGWPFGRTAWQVHLSGSLFSDYGSGRSHYYAV